VRSFVLLVLVVLVVSIARPARAQPATDAGTTTDALYALCQKHDAAFELAEALICYQRVYERDPSSPLAPRSHVRADWLGSHAEGGFQPLVRLERVRRDPKLADDGPTLDALVRDSDAFPAGPVRVEARMLAADAFVGRLHRHADGLALYERVVADPKADPLTARLAARQIVETLIADGQLDEARARASALSNKLDGVFVKHVAHLARRRVFVTAAEIELVAVVLLAAIAVVLAGRRGRKGALGAAMRRVTPLVVAFTAYVGVVGGVLASKYETGNAKPFLVFGAALFPLLLAARAWGAAGSPTPFARAGRAVACAAGAVGAAFVILAYLDPAYLDGYGL
jgi:hypothetical protein